MSGITMPRPDAGGEVHDASPDADETTDLVRDVARSRRYTALVPELTEAVSLVPSSTESASMLVSTHSD
jgi:hypothetical protein